MLSENETFRDVTVCRLASSSRRSEQWLCLHLHGQVTQQDLSPHDTRSHLTTADSATPAVGTSNVTIWILFTLRERDKIQIKLFDVQFK